MLSKLGVGGGNDTCSKVVSLKLQKSFHPVYHVVKWVSVQPRPDMYKWRPFLPRCIHVYKKLRNNTAFDPF